MKILRHTICCAFLFLNVFSALRGQKPADLKRAGEKSFENRHWYDASLALAEYQRQKPGDERVLTKLGICAYHLHDAEKARQYLEFVLNKNPQSSDPDLFYHLARLLHGQQDFQRAIVFYKFFLRHSPEKHPLRAGAVDDIKRCVSAMSLRPSEQIALVENLGERVNTPGDEFAPLPSVNHADRLYFSAAREGSTGGFRNDEGLEDPETGRWRSDMYFTSQTLSGWDFADPLAALLNTSRDEVALSFNQNGRVLYYFRSFSLFSGEMFADTAGRNDEYAIQPPSFGSPFSPEDGDQAPCFFNDSTLVFASRRPGGHGGLDLWLTQFSGGTWTQPANLGETVNSPYDETTTPFLAPDGRTLFFSSNHLGSMGGLDVFKTVFEDNKRAWTLPTNLGIGVNSPADETSFRLTKDGKAAFLASDRLDSFGERDIYIAYFKEENRPELSPSTPAIFADAGKNTPTNEAEPTQPTTVETILLSPLYYNNDQDLLSADNQKVIAEIAKLANTFLEVKIIVTAHTDETGPAKFDLYYGIKRAEIVGKALTEKGIPATRISLFSAGTNFPVARNVIGLEPNPVGQKLNRRVEITFATKEGALPVEVLLKQPEIPEIMVADGARFFEEMTEGLSFKVEVATTRQVLTNDALSMFGEIMIESSPGTGTFRYTAGLFKKFREAAQLRNELVEQGFSDAFVVPFVNGIRITRAEAVGLVKKHPELAAYLKK